MTFGIMLAFLMVAGNACVVYLSWAEAKSGDLFFLIPAVLGALGFAFSVGIIVAEIFRMLP